MMIGTLPSKGSTSGPASLNGKSSPYEFDDNKSSLRIRWEGGPDVTFNDLAYVCKHTKRHVELNRFPDRKSHFYNGVFCNLVPNMDFQEMAVIDEQPSTEGPIRKESGKRGRKPGRKAGDKVDMRAKLERSRQSARECRARKKLRYQYLEELVADREKAVVALRKEFEQYVSWAKDIDEGRIPEGIQEVLEELGSLKQEQ